MHGCCNCGETIKEIEIVCPDCGGLCCTNDCLNEHECDEEGDI